MELFNLIGTIAMEGVDRVNSQLNTMSSKIEAFGNRMSSVGKSLTNIGSSMTTNVTMPIVMGLGYAVKASMDFGQQIANTGALSNATAKEMKGLSDQAMKLGRDTQYSSMEVAKGQTEMIRAGRSVTQTFAEMGDVLSLATAGNIAIAKSAEIGSNMLNMFAKQGITMAQVANQMAGAANSSALDVNNLYDSLRYVGPVAANLNIPFNDLVAVLGVLGNNAIKGSSAGTGLRQMLMRLQPQSDKASAAMQSLGLITKDGGNQFYDASGKVKPLTSVIDILRKSVAGLTDQQRTQKLTEMFGLIASPTVNSLLNSNSDAIEKMGKEINKISASDVATRRMQTFAGSVEYLKGSLETLSVKIGDTLTPILKIFAEQITKVTNKLIDVPKPVLALIITISLIVAAIGPLLLILGTTITIMGTAISIIAGLVSSIGLIGVVIGGVLGAFGLLVASLIGFVLTSGNVRDSIKSHFTSMVDHIRASTAWVKLHVNDIKQALKGIMVGINTGDFTTFGQAMANMFPNNVVQIGNWVNKFKEFRTAAIDLRNTIIDFAISFKAKMIEAKNSAEFKTMLDSFNNVKTSVISLIDNITRLSTAISNIGNDGGGGSAGGGGASAPKKSNGLITLVKNITDVIQSIANVLGWIGRFIGLLASLQEGANKTAGDIKRFEGSVKQSFLNLGTSISSTVGSIVNSIVSWFGQLPSRVGSSVNSLYNTVALVFNYIYSSVVNTVSSLVSTVSSKFSSIASVVNWVSSAFNGLSSAIGGVINKISGIKFPSPPSWLKGLPGFAGGVRNFMGGLAVVGEKGAELVSLPRGSNVYTHEESKRMLMGNNSGNAETDGLNKSSGIVVNINYPQIGNKYDINKIGSDIVSALRKQGVRTI